MWTSGSVKLPGDSYVHPELRTTALDQISSLFHCLISAPSSADWEEQRWWRGPGTPDCCRRIQEQSRGQVAADSAGAYLRQGRMARLPGQAVLVQRAWRGLREHVGLEDVAMQGRVCTHPITLLQAHLGARGCGQRRPFP